MAEQIYYKYTSYNVRLLNSLCHDNIYFSSPDQFNDPFDCNPSIKNDIDKDKLRSILFELIRTRRASEISGHLSKINIKAGKAENFIFEQSNNDAKSKLDYIAYMAQDPEYENAEEAEKWNLVDAVKTELTSHYSKGVYCLSTSYLNPLLWSHYGDEHRGVCIGYSTERNPIPIPQEVIYETDRTVYTSLVYKAFIEKDLSAISHLDSCVLLRKAPEWRYEDEWRLIGSHGEQESPFLLKEITFGLRCPYSVIHSIIKSLEGRRSSVKFYEILPCSDSYMLYRREVDLVEQGIFLPLVAESGAEAFDILK